MKNLFKRTVSVFLAVTMLATLLMMPAFGAESESEYGIYPSHDNLSNFLKQSPIVHGGKANSTIQSPQTNITFDNVKREFTVDGKKFVLLDKDNDGNYFVMFLDTQANADYNMYITAGSYTKDSNYSSYTGQNYQTTALAAGDVSWKFDHSNQNSIAYYLDNTIKGKLPQAIQDNLLLRTWYTEPVFAGLGAGSLTNDETANTYISNFNSNASNVKTSSEGYIALPSYAEWQTYKKYIYVPDGDAGISNATRSALIRVKKVSGAAVTYSVNHLLFKRNSTGNNTAVTYTGIAQPNENPTRIRPVFWLKNDFFKTTKIDVDGMGNDVQKQVLKNSAKELMAAGYTEAELTTLGYDVGFNVTVGTPVLTGATTLAGATQIDVSVDVKNMKDGAVSPVIIIAVYDGSDNSLKALSVKSAETTVAEWTTSTLSATLTKPDDVTFETGDYGEVMVWDNLSNIKPYVGFTSIN